MARGRRERAGAKMRMDRRVIVPATSGGPCSAAAKEDARLPAECASKAQIEGQEPALRALVPAAAILYTAISKLDPLTMRSIYLEKDPAPRGSGGAQTPMMEQFWRAKKEQPEALLFFRMGDFYELFHEDAKVASRELGLTLTARSKGEDAIAMAGVPVRAVEGYLMRLVEKGFKVAICEQREDPRSAKGLVDRAIVRVVTAGTITEENALDAREPNFLACV